MKSIITYIELDGEQAQIEFDNLEDAYSFTYNFECSSIHILGEGVYTIPDFQKWYSEIETA